MKAFILRTNSVPEDVQNICVVLAESAEAAAKMLDGTHEVRAVDSFCDSKDAFHPTSATFSLLEKQGFRSSALAMEYHLVSSWGFSLKEVPLLAL